MLSAHKQTWGSSALLVVGSAGFSLADTLNTVFGSFIILCVFLSMFCLLCKGLIKVLINSESDVFCDVGDHFTKIFIINLNRTLYNIK